MLSDTVGEYDNQASEWSEIFSVGKGRLTIDSHQSGGCNVFELCVNILISAFCATVPLWIN